MESNLNDILDLLQETEILEGLQDTLEENLNGFDEIDCSFLAMQLWKRINQILFETYEQNEIKQAIRRTAYS